MRPATKEQVQSLGAKFIAVEDEEFKQAQTAAGYAKPMCAEYQAKQAELVANHIKTQDIVITTALIPGRPGAEAHHARHDRKHEARLGHRRSGGRARRQHRADGARQDGRDAERREDLRARSISPARSPVNASSLYAKNLLAFLDTMIDKKEKTLKVNWDDDIIKGTLIAKDGRIVHPNLATKSP